MNTSSFTYLLANPSQINKEGQKTLEEIIAKYPYFQSARALQLKGLKKENSYSYNDALKVTAAYTTDRNILFDFITSETFTQNKISEMILQQDESVKEIEVIVENVSQQISKEIDEEIKKEIKKAEAILNPQLFERKVASLEKLATESPKETKEEKIELIANSPLDFNKEDTHSFSEWLKLTTATPIKREEKEEQSASQQQQNRLIDQFIQNKPKLSPSKSKEENNLQNDLASPYSQTSKSLMTETLAKVYLQQKNYKKALQAYQILILKYPEKSGFFADQIRAIKKMENK